MVFVKGQYSIICMISFMLLFDDFFVKVFCDNYLDGGYHVPYAHRDLASGLTMDSYSTTVIHFYFSRYMILFV